MRVFTSTADRLASQRLLKACTAIIEQYRKEFGHLPEWVHELEPTSALKLLAPSSRVGMKLPTHETLTIDQRGRERASARAINHGLRKQPR